MTERPLPATLPVRLGRPRGADWVAAGRLLAPGAPLLEERLRGFGERIAAPRPAVAASLLLEAYSGLLASVGFGCLLGAGVLPDLRAGSVSLRFGAGGVPDLVALHRRPAAPARPEAALGRLAGGMLDGHLGLLVARLGELRVRRGPWARWGLVANGCANALVEAAAAAGYPPQRIRELVSAFFRLPGAPPGPPRLLEVPVDGGTGTTLLRKRLSCCLFFALPGCEPCATCPAFRDEQAVRRAAARLGARRAPAG